MDSSKNQTSLNPESDDFLKEFFNFVQQYKETEARQAGEVPVVSVGCNVVHTENKSEMNITPASEGTFALDLAIPSSDTSFIIDGSSTRSVVGNTNDFPSVSSDETIINVLSEPVISAEHALNPYLIQTKSDGINDTFIPFYNEGHDDITERVSAELEKVLNDPAAFEDIELYLECSEDDIETIQEDTAFGTGNFSLHAGNSAIQSDVNLKISFPPTQDEYINIKRCSSCKLPFTSDSDLLNHLDMSSCEVLLCKDCIYNTKSVKRFLTHMEKRHSVSGIDRLLYNFTNSFRKLQNTSSTHSVVYGQDHLSDNDPNVIEEHIEKTVTDIVCDSHLTSSDLNEGQLNKMETNYPCNFCQYIGKSTKLLKMHQQNLHSANRRLYDCQICDFTCVQKRTFDGHMKTHEESYLFSCSECKCRFTTGSALNRHLKIHKTERLYICNICSKRFKIKGTLTDHTKKVHKIGTPISTTETSDCNGQKQDFDLSKNPRLEMIAPQTTTCDTEDISKAQNVSTTAIELHNSVEKDTQGYKISEHSVNSDSKLQETVNGNLRKPTKDEGSQTKSDRHFLCSWPGCGKRFRDNYNLNNHYSRHTLSKKLSCSECDFKCIQKGHLRYHQRTKHAKRKNVKN